MRASRSVLVLSLLLSTAASTARAQDDEAAAILALEAALRPVADVTRRGDTDAALAALAALPAETRALPAARYLEARLRERTGELDAVARLLAPPLEGLPSALESDAARRRARALALTGHCDDAERLLAALARPTPTDRALRAECALARGDLATAESALGREVATAADEVDTFALRLALSEAQLRAGHRDDAIATLRRLVVQRPEHPSAAQAERALVTLSGDSAELTREERMQRAERLSEMRRHDDAIAELDRAGMPPRSETATHRRYLHLLGDALFSQRHSYPRAAQILTLSARAGGPHALADQLRAARALSRAGDDAGAVRGYRALSRAHRAEPLGIEADYLAALIELRDGRPRAMRRFLASPRGRGSAFADEARWHVALADFDARRFGPAAAAFAASSTGSALERARGRYWEARAREGARARREAIEAYRATLAIEPLGWYALLARQRLVALGEEPGPPTPERAREDTWSPSRVELSVPARYLRAMGLDGEAATLLRSDEARARADADLRALTQTYVELGAWHRAYQLTNASDSLRRPPTGLDAWAWDAAYPRAFEEAVAPAARAMSIRPELAWAVMRQESAYQPEVVSYADAIGLMQLLPSTAGRIASRLGVSFRREMLFVPAWNARFGSAYLAELERRFGVPLCFAAYNAGEHRVEEWRRARGDMELDRFVEAIPYDQTRGYVRRVTAHYAHYLYAAQVTGGGDAGAWPELSLPTHARAD